MQNAKINRISAELAEARTTHDQLWRPGGSHLIDTIAVQPMTDLGQSTLFKPRKGAADP